MGLGKQAQCSGLSCATHVKGSKLKEGGPGEEGVQQSQAGEDVCGSGLLRLLRLMSSDL